MLYTRDYESYPLDKYDLLRVEVTHKYYEQSRVRLLHTYLDKEIDTLIQLDERVKVEEDVFEKLKVGEELPLSEKDKGSTRAVTKRTAKEVLEAHKVILEYFLQLGSEDLQKNELPRTVLESEFEMIKLPQKKMQTYRVLSFIVFRGRSAETSLDELMKIEELEDLHERNMERFAEERADEIKRMKEKK